MTTYELKNELQLKIAAVKAEISDKEYNLSELEDELAEVCDEILCPRGGYTDEEIDYGLRDEDLKMAKEGPSQEYINNIVKSVNTRLLKLTRFLKYKGIITYEELEEFTKKDIL